MSDALRDALEREIAQLTNGDKPDRASELAAGMRRSARNWAERMKGDPKATRWEALDAYLGRVDTDADFSSAWHEERVRFCQAAFRDLIARDGFEYAAQDLTRIRVVRRLAAGPLELRSLDDALHALAAAPKAQVPA